MGAIVCSWVEVTNAREGDTALRKRRREKE